MARFADSRTSNAAGRVPVRVRPRLPGFDQQMCHDLPSQCSDRVDCPQKRLPLKKRGVSAGSALSSSRSGDPPAAVAPSEESAKALSSCRLCPRKCGVNRLAGETGFCRAGLAARVAAVSIHHGEEPPVSGSRGSGTVFFAHCNMTCLFCQNYPISQLGHGRDMDTETLAGELLKLQGKGAHNVNFVTPTPHVPQLVDAVRAARGKGFALPVVYNTNGYDSHEALALLDGVVDVYLPDAKFRSRELSEKVSGAPDYPGFNDAALAEMVRQVGFLETSADGIATRGVLVRHLVLPGRVGETVRVLGHLKEVFGPDLRCR